MKTENLQSLTIRKMKLQIIIQVLDNVSAECDQMLKLESEVKIDFGEVERGQEMALEKRKKLTKHKRATSVLKGGN